MNKVSSAVISASVSDRNQESEYNGCLCCIGIILKEKPKDPNSVLGMDQIQIAGGERSPFQVLQLQSRAAPRTVAAEQDVLRTFL